MNLLEILLNLFTLGFYSKSRAIRFDSWGESKTRFRKLSQSFKELE